MAKRILPPLKTLRAFEAAARHANFTAAADELNITHSAVSQQIRLLEDYLDGPLFAREARGVVLLPHAREYFLEVQACLDRISSATQALKSPHAPRILRVCTTPSLAMKWLIPRLAGFQDWEPRVDVQIATVNSRFIEQAVQGRVEAVELVAAFIVEHPRLQPGHGIEQGHSGNFTARQHEVS